MTETAGREVQTLYTQQVEDNEGRAATPEAVAQVTQDQLSFKIKQEVHKIKEQNKQPNNYFSVSSSSFQLN